jgi:ElaB/YqjD/DUF883 family membrane-anchored ribosome-binding protein
MAVDERMNGSVPANADALRAEIAATRAQLGETVEALAMKTDVKARTKDAVNQSVAEAKDRGHQAVNRGQRALGRGREAVARQQRALVGKIGETAKNPAAVWAGAAIGGTVGVGVATIIWLRARQRSTEQYRAMSAWEQIRARARR